MKTFFNCVKIFSVVCGAIVGAGFLSGVELLSFFGTENFIAPLVFAAALFFIALVAAFRTEEYEDCAFSEGKIFSAAIKVSDFVFLTGTLAGLDCVFGDFAGGFPVCSVFAIVFAAFYSKKKGGGLEKLNVILSPVIIISVNVFLLLLIFRSPRLVVVKSVKKLGVLSFARAAAYVFMNVFAALPVLKKCSKNKSKKEKIIASAAFGAFAFLQSAIILVAIKRSDAFFAEIPVIEAVKAFKFVFPLKLALFLGVFTSFYSYFLPVYNRDKNGKTNVSGIAAVIAAFLLSRLGLNRVIAFFYPVVGAFGATYFIKLFFSAVKKGIKNKKITDNKRVSVSGGRLCQKRKSTK